MTGTHPTLADLDALAAEEPFVRALARSLLGGDRAAADDVVQQTWLELVRRGAPDPATRRGWLARVVRSRASNLRRAEARRASREREVARPEAVLGPDALIARAEQRRMVVEAVAALPEPYRTVVLLRYLEGLGPRAIAARLAVPRDTVATRLKRALAMLRERLDAVHGGDRSAWVGALSPLALPARGAAGGVLAASSAIKLLLIGSATALLFVWLRWSPEPDSPPPVAAGERATAAAPAQATRIARTAAALAEEPPRRELTAPVAAAAALPDLLAEHGARVVGRAVLADGTPAVARACRLWTVDPWIALGGIHDPLGEPQAGGPTWLDTKTDASGRFAFDRVPPGGLHALWLAHGSANATWHELPRTPAARELIDVGTVVLDQLAAVVGVVVGPDGEPLEGAEIWAADLPGAVLGAAPFDRLEAEGALFVGLPELPDGDAARQAERVRRHLATWLPQAEPDAAFQVLPMPSWAARLWRELPRPQARSAADGHFRLEGVPPGNHVLVVTAAGLANEVRPRVLVREGEECDVGELRLREGETLGCRVLSAAGTPLAGAEVRVALRPRVGITGILFGSPARFTDAGGQTRFDGLPRGELVVAFRATSGGPWSTLGPVDSGDELELALPASRELRVALRRADGPPPEAVKYRLLQGPPFGEATAAGFQQALDPARHVVDEGVDGDAHRLVLRELVAGPYTLIGSAPGTTIETRAFVVTAESPEELELELRAARRCTVEVVDPAGEPVAGAEVSLLSEQESSEAWARSLLMERYGGIARFRRMPRLVGRTAADGRATVEHLPAGTVSVLVRHPGFGVEVATSNAPEGGLRVQFALPGRIEGRITENGRPPADGQQPIEVVAKLVQDASTQMLPDVELHLRPAADGRFRFDALRPGRYEVSAKRGAGGAPRSLGELVMAMAPSWGSYETDAASRRVVVHAGETAELIFDVDPLAPREGESGGALHGRVALDGQPIAGARVVARAAAGSLLENQHEIGVTTEDGRFARDDPTRRSGLHLTVTIRDGAVGDGVAVTWTRDLGEQPQGDVDFVADGATLRIRAIGYDGTCAAGHVVSLTGSPQAGGELIATARTAVDGTATLVVPAGRYGISVEGSQGDAFVGDVELAGRVARELRLTTAGVVSGRVQPRDGLSVARILLSDVDGQRFWSTSSDDGTFAFTDVPEGRYELRIGAGNDSYFAEPRTLEVGPDGAVGLTVGIGARDDG